MAINEIFSKNLARIRKLKGYSQRELGRKTGLSYRMINYYENNPKSVPINKLKLLAEALDAKIADFFDEQESNLLDDLDVRWIKKINQVKNLSEADQKEINRHINYLVEKAKFSKQKQTQESK